MKTTHYILLTVMVLISLQSANGLTVASQNLVGQCDNPTNSISIDFTTGQLSFGNSEYRVDKGICLQLTVSNPDVIEHELTIEHPTEPTLFEKVNLKPRIQNSVAVNIQIPNSDTLLEFYDPVPGHQAAGEAGFIFIGMYDPNQTTNDSSDSANDKQNTKDSGNSDNSAGPALPVPGFELGLTTIFGISAILMFRKRHR